VLDAQARAALLLLCTPDDAFQLLKSALHVIRDDPDLSEPDRMRLESRLEWSLWAVAESGGAIKRLQADWQARKGAFQARLTYLLHQLQQGQIPLGLLLGTE
jgi:hypothetical protein